MPPRRSSRSARASVEPSQPEALPAKRKRGQTAEVIADEAETSQKPPSRAKRAPTRSGSASAPKSRSSTRGKPSLPEVAESQAEEESDAQPAKKRSRPSDEGLQNVKLEEQNELIHKPVSGKRSRGSMRQMEGAGSRARAGDGPGSSIAPASNRSARSRKGKEVEEPSPGEEQEDEEEGVERLVVQRPSRAAQKRNSIPDEELVTSESDANEEEFKPTTKKSRKPLGRNTSNKQRKPRKEATPEEEEQNVPHSSKESANRQNFDIEDDDIPDFKPKPSPRKQRQSTREPVVEEEEEKSLFEPPPMPPPASTAPPPPEESSGPKSRLMIHMMALVNFKSYAGRQVIGPFHKVRISQVPLDFSQYGSL